jgi:hypothetical protein
MHHLILIRETEGMGGPGCCSRIGSDGAIWGSDRAVFTERRERSHQLGEILRAIRDAFGHEVEVTIVDPRNLVSFIPLVIRDAIRHRVPVATALRALSSTSVMTGVFDGQLLFSGEIPTTDEVMRRISGRMSIDRVGAIPGTSQTPPS